MSARLSARVLSPHHPDVLRSFRRRSPADSAVGSSAPPGSHAAPPALDLVRSRKGGRTCLVGVISILALLSASLLACASWVFADLNKNGVLQGNKEITEFLESFFASEEREQYEKCYGFFSRRYKSDLGKAGTITTPKDYREARREGEAHWFGSQIKSIGTLEGSKFRVVVKSNVKAEGETEVVERMFILVKEGKDWRIDDIDY